MEAKGVPLSERMTAGKAELTENLDEYRLGELHRCGIQASALEQESAEAVLDGEGIAVAAVAHLELTFEVDGPDRIRLIHGGERLAGMARFAGASTLLRDQIVTSKIRSIVLRAGAPPNFTAVSLRILRDPHP